MKKTIAMIIAMLLMVSIFTYCVAEILSINEIQSKLEEYIEFLSGEWSVRTPKTNAFGLPNTYDNSSDAVTFDKESLSMNSLGQLFWKGKNYNCEILFTADDDVIMLRDCKDTGTGEMWLMPYRRIH